MSVEASGHASALVNVDREFRSPNLADVQLDFPSDQIAKLSEIVSYERKNGLQLAKNAVWRVLEDHDRNLPQFRKASTQPTVAEFVTHAAVRERINRTLQQDQ